jgi:hypothetical protein
VQGYEHYVGRSAKCGQIIRADVAKGYMMPESRERFTDGPTAVQAHLAFRAGPARKYGNVERSDPSLGGAADMRSVTVIAVPSLPFPGT